MNTKGHCWADKREWAVARIGPYSEVAVDAHYHNATCLLEAGHDGPHEWTPDDEIVVEFKPTEDRR